MLNGHRKERQLAKSPGALAHCKYNLIQGTTLWAMYSSINVGGRAGKNFILSLAICGPLTCAVWIAVLIAE